MDSRTVQSQEGAAVDEAKLRELEQLQLIKTVMPQTYDMIKRKAETQGNGVYTLVRRGLRGQPGCFWACEGGLVVGTSFGASHPLSAAIAQALVQYGPASVCILAEVVDGAH